MDIIEFPKWVPVHKDHIRTDAYGQYVPHGFDEYHYDRVAKRFIVLVKTADEEALATSPKAKSEPHHEA